MAVSGGWKFMMARHYTMTLALTALLLLAGCLDAPDTQTETGGTTGSYEPALTTEKRGSPLNQSHNLTVHFIDVGQGDSILVQLPNGGEILIDGGDKGRGGDVVAYLRSRGVEDLEMVVSTSPDADHLGGLLYVLQNFRVMEVVESGQKHTTRTYSEYRTLIESLNLSVRAVKSGDVLDLDPGVSIRVLSPPSPLFTGTRSDTNANSVVLLLDYNSTEILLTGDAEAVTEDYLMLSPVDVDILKVAHHGSRYSSSWRFLSAFSPEVGVISAGCGNPYGHPHNETLDRLAALGIRVFTTCTHGDIVVTSNGRDYAVLIRGEAVQAAAAPSRPRQIVICEVIYDPPGPEPENEAITICNTGDSSVDLRGWMLSDGEGSYTIQGGVVIEAGGKVRISGAEYNPSGNPGGMYLSNRHDEVLLFNPSGELVDIWSW